MRQDYTHLTVVLDSSGSMQDIKGDTIGGFNQLLADQKAAPGKATFSLFTFASHNDVRSVSGLQISDALALTPDLYRPSGNTAMYDGIMLAINETGKWLAEIPEEERPANVVVAIITDGYENDSRKHTLEDVRAAVQHQQDTYKWQFTFLAANQDGVLGGAEIGIAADASVTFTPASTSAAYTSMSASLLRVRGGRAVGINYTDAERKAAVGK